MFLLLGFLARSGKPRSDKGQGRPPFLFPRAALIHTERGRRGGGHAHPPTHLSARGPRANPSLSDDTLRAGAAVLSWCTSERRGRGRGRGRAGATRVGETVHVEFYSLPSTSHELVQGMFWGVGGLWTEVFVARRTHAVGQPPLRRRRTNSTTYRGQNRDSFGGREWELGEGRTGSQKRAGDREKGRGGEGTQRLIATSSNVSTTRRRILQSRRTSHAWSPGKTLLAELPLTWKWRTLLRSTDPSIDPSTGL